MNIKNIIEETVLKFLNGNINEEIKYSQERLGDIYFIFNRYSELSNIGSIRDYEKYLKTIFPNSKVRDIVYHTTDNLRLDHFHDNLRSGIHFGSIKQGEMRRNFTDFENKNRYKLIAAIIEIKNPLITKDFDWEKSSDAFEMWGPDDDLSDIDFTNYLITSGIANYNDIITSDGDFDIINKKGYDGVIYLNEGERTGEYSYAVSKSNQIHILGSKRDIEGFIKYIDSVKGNKLNIDDKKTT
jgi:hypothetical protein